MYVDSSNATGGNVRGSPCSFRNTVTSLSSSHEHNYTSTYS
jgi:hypothetical protein